MATQQACTAFRLIKERIYAACFPDAEACTQQLLYNPSAGAA